MASALVSATLGQLVAIIREQAEQNVRLVVGVEEEVDNLTSNLHAIQAGLEDAEIRQVKEAIVKKWLADLIDVSYDMDDVLDEWNTAILKNAPSLWRKVCSIVLSCLSCPSCPSCPSCFCYKQFTLRGDIAIKIKELNARVDVIARERSVFNFTQMSGAREPEPSMTTSMIDVSEVHGRDEDKDTIIKMLLSESSQGPNLRIISIVGMGGIGKTTLARLVFNDSGVQTHFSNNIIWVCVSDPFDEKRIAKAILEGLHDSAPDVNELDTLLRRICKSVENKMFLLVLDDMWNEDDKKWKQLHDSLKFGLPGSRILVTTRKEKVAETTTHMFPLGQLSNDKCWSLFSQLAFSRRSREECKNLIDIGQGIVDKCKGLPLAVNFLGRLLSFRKTIPEWQSVLDSEVWKLKEAEIHLFPHLLLSYYDLHSTMRRCFSYCAIFPKDYELKKDRLIKLWMAQGYLTTIDNEDMEMVGEDCFRNLAMRSFFQDFVKDENDQIIKCKMHDIVHDFAQFLTKNECVVMEDNGAGKSMLDFSHVKGRHSMLMRAESVSFPTSFKNVKKLRSLIIEWKGLQMTTAVLYEIFDQLTCLRTLDLSRTPSLREVPKRIGKLIHLRYLNLAYNGELKELPETVCDLCNLQILNVTFCRFLKKLPQGFGKLINLRHLEILGTNIKFMPKGVENLTSLRTLDTFHVSSGVNDSEASNIGDLKNLNQLRGRLLIEGLGNVRDVDEVKKVQLKDKQHLLDLGLDFRGEEAEGRMINDEQVIEALEPSPNLEELRIRLYRGTTMSPNWMMSLTNLKKFHIYRCHKLEALPNHLLHSTSLKELEIYVCPILEERYYKEREGEDWPKISHIPNIIINDYYVQKEGRFMQIRERERKPLMLW